MPVRAATGLTQGKTEHVPDLGCKVAKQLDSWAQSDIDTAFGTAGAGQLGKSLSGRLSVRAGKGLLGVSEVFGATALLEASGSALINGVKSGDLTEGVAVAAQKLTSVAAGVEGLGGATADKLGDQLVRHAGLRTPCD